MLCWVVVSGYWLVTKCKVDVEEWLLFIVGVRNSCS